MPTKQINLDGSPIWELNKDATRDLNENFFGTFLEIKHIPIVGGMIVDKLMISVLTPINLSIFNWDAAERRADWEAAHRHFSEFGDIKDLLSDLHS
jgi:hypothetical protein